MKKTLLPLFFAGACALTACGPASMSAEEQNALCNEYCEIASVDCQGEFEIYSTTLECFETCKGFNFNGTEGDLDGDTAQCRLYHIGVAESDPSLHCDHASPGGGGVCKAPGATLCGSYCGQIAEKCDRQEFTRQYDSLGDCENQCLNFRENGSFGDADGNTIQCRSTRLEDENLSPVDRCNEAGFDSTICVDPAS